MDKKDGKEKTWADTVIEAPLTIRETIYRHIKEAIFRGELQPGQRITERETARIFNVSSGPVREAFQILSAEKLLNINARKEVHVVFATLDDVKKLVDFVIDLDLLAVKRALKFMGDEDIADLKHLTRELGELCSEKDRLDFSKLNMRIHEKIWTASKNPYLYEALSSNHEKLLILVNHFIFSRKPAVLSTSYESHLELLNVLENRDMRKAVKVVTKHWDWILDHVT
ncbi:MAG: GntR family transcriptional regulator [Acidobacteriota bacterium]|nr:GntR family transcriptional regulator [Acidobacteriota bacterium]